MTEAVAAKNRDIRRSSGSANCLSSVGDRLPTTMLRHAFGGRRGSDRSNRPAKKADD
jgi:hypothetical protein